MIQLNSTFFADVRRDLFGGHITQSQVDGFTFIVDAWNRAALSNDVRWLAYCLATTYHETAQTMEPIEEFGHGRGHAYGVPNTTTGKIYYGRGYVQLTWERNYLAMTKIVGQDLVNHPELALQPEIAAQIMLHGMSVGTFTGRKLGDYFNATANDSVNARRIINGLDKAATIAAYHKNFIAALSSTTVA